VPTRTAITVCEPGSTRNVNLRNNNNLAIELVTVCMHTAYLMPSHLLMKRIRRRQ